jgi:diguanylate cyclase (GGDEF)-like protein
MTASAGQYSGHWSTHQLTEYFAAVSLPETEGDVLVIATERAAECLDAEFGAVVLDRHVVAATGFGTADPPADLADRALGVTRSQAPDGREVHFLTARMDGPGSLSTAVSGGLVVGRFEAAFIAEEEQMLRALATVLGLVLRNLRSLAVERARHNLLSNLLEVQRSISNRRPLQEVLDAVTGATSRLLGVATATLVLSRDDDAAALYVVSRHGHSDRHDDPLQDDRVAVDTARRALERDSPVTAVEDNEVTLLADVVAVPVHLNAQTTGALVAWKAGWGQVSDLQNELLTLFAHQVSVAITDAHTMATLQEALHDHLTGLASRELFCDRLDHACTIAGRRGEPLSLLFIDLDEFKAINDTFGHAAGDQVLVEVSRRLTEQLRASDTAARLGGDEFVVLLEGHARADAVEPAERILEALRRPILVDGREIVVGASIGIADDDAGRADPPDILAAADDAMYAAKRSHTSHVSISTASTSLPQRAPLTTLP